MAESTTPSTTSGARIAMIDVARFYGMFLVYYGHIVEQVMYLGSEAAAIQYKFIYSFHMPLFFLLSGTIAGESRLGLPVGRFLKRLLASRLLPYALFSVLLCIASLFLPGWHPLGELNSAEAYLKGWISTLMGFPAFCLPLWFMALLVGVEAFHYVVSRLVKHPAGLAVAALLLYAGGYWLNEAYFFVGEGKAFWFLNEVPVVYLFYAAGVLLRRSGGLEREWNRPLLLAAGVACLAVVWLTFDLNQGPFRIIQAVVVVLSGHGSMFWFPFTAFAGIAFTLLAARALPTCGWTAWMGRNALSLFCLNGVFYHFVNQPMAIWFSSRFPLTGWPVFGYSLAMTVASLALCVPVTMLLTTWLPQFMGKPAQRGPLFGPVVRAA